MKAIISHDVDHITVSEHLFRDLIVPKYMLRMHVELLSNKISIREYILRWSDLFKNKWQNIDELITFNNINQVPSSFFIAVEKGVGLNYTNDLALLWISQMMSRDAEIGIHGIAFDNQAAINAEFSRFSTLSGLRQFGIRMHYVRNMEATYQMLSNQGYSYDSTEHAFKNPYKIGEMWEFPFQIMDGWVIENGKSWQSVNLQKAKDTTLFLIEKAHNENLRYLNIDFHDRYFSHAFKTWLDWYVWVIEYLRSQGIEFVNYTQAVNELNQQSQ